MLSIWIHRRHLITFLTKLKGNVEVCEIEGNLLTLGNLFSGKRQSRGNGQVLELAACGY